MKQKNLILIAVAVGCGLVAAVLSSQLLSSKPKQEMVRILVAKRELPQGMKITKDDVDQYVGTKELPKEAAPQGTVESKESLIGMRVKRTYYKDEPFNQADLADFTPIKPPEGFDMMTFSASVERAVAGFAGPGCRVDILASVKMPSQKGKSKVFPLLRDMLILAIDDKKDYPNNGAVFVNLSNVSVAVTKDQALLLHAAIGRGADLRLLMLNPEKPTIWKEKELLDKDQIWAILTDEPQKLIKTPDGEGADDVKGPVAEADTVSLMVAKEDLPAGTKLTAKLVKEKFRKAEFKKPAPENAIEDLREFIDGTDETYYLAKDLSANQFVPKSYLTTTDPSDKRKAGADDSATPKTAPEEKTVPVEQKDVVYTTVETSSGVKRYAWERLKNGSWKFLGEAKDDGSAAEKEPKAPAKPAKPDAKDEKKDKDDKEEPGDGRQL